MTPSEADWARKDAIAGQHLVPPHLREGLLDHIMNGRPVGGFLTAVLTNDLREAVARADDTSLPCLKMLVQYLHNYAPGICWGSPLKVQRWIANGGINGQIAAVTKETAS